MEFRSVATKKVQAPSLDEDDLDLESAQFKGEFDFKEAVIRSGDQQGVLGEGSLSTTLVEAVSLAGARVEPLELSNTSFRQMDLSNATLGQVTARRVEFLGCRATGLSIDFTLAQDVYFEGCQLDFTNFRIGQTKNALVFKSCTFTEAAFSGDLSNVVFNDCELTKTEFEATKAAGCDFTGSRLAGIQGILTLRGASLDMEQASSIAIQIATEAGLLVNE